MSETHRQPADTDMSTYPPFIRPYKPDLINHCRNKEERDKERDCQINNHHSSEILQVQPYLLIQEEDDDQCAHCRQSSRQHGHECFQITPVQDMVGHHNSAVYHKIQGHCYPRQRIQLHFQPEKIVENNCHSNVNSQTGDYQQQIFQVQRNNPDKYQQDKHRQPCTEINFVQFFADILCSVIAGMHFITGWQCQAYRLHFFHHLIAQLQLIGSFYSRDGHINRIQPIDAIIALRCFFYMGHRYQFIQTDNSAIRSRHRDIRRIELSTDSIRHQHQAYPLFTGRRVHIMRAQKFFIIV